MPQQTLTAGVRETEIIAGLSRVSPDPSSIVAGKRHAPFAPDPRNLCGTLPPHLRCIDPLPRPSIFKVLAIPRIRGRSVDAMVEGSHARVVAPDALCCRCHCIGGEHWCANRRISPRLVAVGDRHAETTCPHQSPTARPTACTTSARRWLEPAAARATAAIGRRAAWRQRHLPAA